MNKAISDEDLPNINASPYQSMPLLEQPPQPNQKKCLKCEKAYDDSYFQVVCQPHRVCIACRAQNLERCVFMGCFRNYNREERQNIDAYIKKLEENFFTCEVCGVKKQIFMRKIRDQCDCKVCLMCSIDDPYECPWCCLRSSEIIISDIKGIACTNCNTILDTSEELHTHNCFLSH